jgi:Ca2+-binding EF-hand superfamily protein
MFTRLISRCGAMALLASTLVAGAQEPGQGENANSLQLGALKFVVDSEGAGKYWIGVAVQPRGDGLLIEDVTPDSPAAKAGLKSGDVILAVKDTQIKDYEQLAKLVADSEGQTLELRIHRENSEDRPKIADWAKGLLKQFDANKDGSLAKDEWQKMRPHFHTADDDKNGVITFGELERKLLSFVDLRRNMSVMVDPIKQSGGGLVIIAADEKQDEENDDDAKARPVAPPQPGPQFRIEGVGPGGEDPGWKVQLIPAEPGNQKQYDPRVIGRTDKEVLPRFDRDRDGHISAEESRESDWDPPFADSDLDGDGRLSRAELYERYAKKMNLPPSTAATVTARAPGQPGPAWHPMMPGSPGQLPDDMEVKITKKGNEPAVVKASQGKKSWKTTEDDLGMLPPPAQAYAARLLGTGPAPGSPWPGSGGRGVPGAPGMSGPPGMAPRAGAAMLPEPPGGTPPAGGLRFEIRETEAAKRAANDPSEREREIRRLRDQEEVLRQAIEELRKRTRGEGESERD